MNSHVSNFTDHSKAPADIERVAEAILDGDKERAIDLLLERYPQLVSYQHQTRIHSTVNAGRSML
jgi:hypothetical protein